MAFSIPSGCGYHVITANGDIYESGNCGLSWSFKSSVFGGPIPVQTETIGRLKARYRGDGQRMNTGIRGAAVVAFLVGGFVGAFAGYSQGTRKAHQEARSADERWRAATHLLSGMTARWHRCENQMDEMLTAEQRAQRKAEWERFEAELARRMGTE